MPGRAVLATIHQSKQARVPSTELLSGAGTFPSLEEDQLEVAHYLDTYFNLDRRHSVLGYHSPHQLEADLLKCLSLASRSLSVCTR